MGLRAGFVWRVVLLAWAALGAAHPGEAAAAPADQEAGAPPATRVIKTIPADADRYVVVELNEVKRREAIVSVVISVRYEGDRRQSEAIHFYRPASKVVVQASGEAYPAMSADGYTYGHLKSGEIKTLRVLFKAPRLAGKVAIALSGIGTFHDVEIEE